MKESTRFVYGAKFIVLIFFVISIFVRALYTRMMHLIIFLLIEQRNFLY